MRCAVLKTLLLSLLQLFPQLEETMIRTLKESLEHYEQLKLMEDMLKEDNTVCVASRAGFEPDSSSEKETMFELNTS